MSYEDEGPDLSDAGSIPSLEGGHWAAPSMTDRAANPDRYEAVPAVTTQLPDLTEEQAEFVRAHGLDADAIAEMFGNARGAGLLDTSGVPAAPDDYFVRDLMPENDAAAVAPFLEVAHAAGMTERQTRAALDAYYQNEARLAEHQHSLDAAVQAQAEDALRREWGERYDTNLRGAVAAVDRTFGKAMRNNLLFGRLADGTPIGSSPAVLRALARLAQGG